MRVVSLLPAATEILCQIGARHLLVGRSHECDYPPGLESVPVLTTQTTHYNPDAGVDAAEIDRQVKAQLAEGRSLYRLDTQRLAELRPDLVITQDICGVCPIDAATVRTVARHMQAAFGSRPEVLSLNPATLEDVLDNHLAVGAAVKMEREARDAVARLRERLFRAEEMVAPFARQPVVGFMEWTDPIYVAGHWNVELIERAGGRHPLNETVAMSRDGSAMGPQRGLRRANPSFSVTSDQFAALAPEYLVVAPCGLTLHESVRAAEMLTRFEWFRALPAVQRAQVVAVDGSAFFNRPGPRLIDAFEFLVTWLHCGVSKISGEFPWRLIRPTLG